MRPFGNKMPEKNGASKSVGVIIESLDTHPACEHGPAILFHRQNDNNDCQRFYACSACRDQNECPLFIRYDENTQNSANHRAAMLNGIAEKSIKLANEQSILLQMV